MVVVVVGKQDIPRLGAVKGGNYLGCPRRGVNYQAFSCLAANNDVAVGFPRAQDELIDKNSIVTGNDNDN